MTIALDEVAIPTAHGRKPILKTPKPLDSETHANCILLRILVQSRTSKAIRLQFRTEQQLAAVQAKTTATKQTIASASAGLGQTINAGSSKPATETTMGEKLFLQRCSICHLGVPPSFKTYGPLLHKELLAAMGEDAVRKAIMEGSPKMPSWKYSLKPGDVDKILAYLKTVTKEEVTHRPSGESPDEQIGGN